LGCLSVDECLRFVAGSASAPAPENVWRHVETCSDCRRVVAEAARNTVETSSPPHAQQTGERAALRAIQIDDVLLDRYEIRRFIARGGMGEVYEAFDRALSESVALKTLTLATTDDPGAADRLRDEVRLARKVSHPNVCRILEYGVHRPTSHLVDVVPFLTMELLHGETLAARLRRSGRLSPELAAEVLRGTLSGLGAVHGAGIVHRDLKSENIFLSLAPGAGGAPRVVVMDFGLAKARRVDGSKSSTAGAVVGTLDYMAPEQLAGRPATPSSDIYALGVIAFEMLGGCLPYEGPSQLARAARKLTEAAPRVSTHGRGANQGWDEVVARCLERDPTRRPANLREVAAAFDGVALSKPRSRSAVAAGLFVAATAGLLVAGLVGSRRKDQGQARPAPLVSAPLTRQEPTVASASSVPRTAGSAAEERDRRRRPRRSGATRATSDGSAPDKSAPGGPPVADEPASLQSASDRRDPLSAPAARVPHPDDLVNPFETGSHP
jgi:hypothetical protein